MNQENNIHEWPNVLMRGNDARGLRTGRFPLTLDCQRQLRKKVSHRPIEPHACLILDIYSNIFLYWQVFICPVILLLVATFPIEMRFSEQKPWPRHHRFGNLDLFICNQIRVLL